jgi:nucleoid-associated protein YgaU
MDARRAAGRLADLALVGLGLLAAWGVVLSGAREQLAAADGWAAAAAGLRATNDTDRAVTALLAVLAPVALAVAVPLLLWLTLVVVGTALGQLPGAVGRAAQRCVDAVTPVACRRLARVALGLAVSGASAGVGLTAQAASQPSVDELPGVGRPVVSAPAAPGARPAELPAGGATASAAPTPIAVPTRVAAPPEPSPRPAVAARTAPAAGSGPGAARARRPAPAVPSGVPMPRPAARASAGLAGPASGETSGATTGVTPGATLGRPGHAVVRRGDCLWDIAARSLGPHASPAAVAHEWPRWFAVNRTVIGDDPDLLLPGTVLRAPAPEEDPWR